MECGNCQNFLADAKDLFFLTRSIKMVSLVVKPECKAVLEKRSFVRVPETKKKVRVKCNKCLSNVGTGIPYGPDGVEYTAFSTDKIVLCGKTFSAKQKWSELLSIFHYIEKRNLENFYGEAVMDQVMEVEERTAGGNVEKGPVKFASTINDFEWLSLTPRKTPRSYQIDAYIEALQQNLVIIIDTGLGKTLIASMVIARMKSLNPFHLAVMLVDRIPLIFQQGQSIMEDTDLRVCRLCSENRTKKRIKQLHDGTYDVLVATAGSFLEMLNQKQIQISDCCVIVFDECHHSTGDHVYSQVLREIQSCLPMHKPRVIGLTASPFTVENVVKGRNKLAKFRTSFLDASFFYPTTEVQKIEAKQIKVVNSPRQDQFINDSLSVIRKTVADVNSVVKGYCKASTIDKSQLNALKGHIKALVGEYPDKKELKVIATEVLFLIDVMEVCELLGISHAVAILKQGGKLPISTQKLLEKYDIEEIVPAHRLAELERILQGCSPETRAIVFVRTQLSARRLFDHLTVKFPYLSPRMVLGHGGHFGMSWEDEQFPALRDFKEGKTNLLVATSVLEEGLDVSECDLVVRYSGTNTLTNFIQSRGRARKPGSKFFVFIDSTHKYLAKDLEDQERILAHLIKVEGSRDCLPSVRSKRIKSALESETSLHIQDKRAKCAKEVDKSNTITVEVYVRLEDHDSNLQDALVTEVEQYDLFKVQRFFSIEKSAEVASGIAGVFYDYDRAFLLSLRSSLGDAEHAYKSFCELWDFELTSLSYLNEAPHVWLKHGERKMAPNNLDYFQSKPTVVEMGKFKSNQSFESSVVFCRRSNDALALNDAAARRDVYHVTTFTFDGSIEINFGFNEESFGIKIAFSDLNNFALISTAKGKMCLYLPYRNTAMIRSHREDRIFGHAFLARSVSANSVIAVTFESDSFEKPRRVLTAPKFFPVPIFDSKVQHEYCLDLEHVLQNSLSRLETDCKANDCIWLVKAIQSRKDACVPNKLLLYLCEQLQQELKEGAKHLQEFQIALEKVLNNSESYWVDLKGIFDRNFKNLKTLPPSSLKLVQTPIPDNHVLVKRLVCTPTRVICLSPTPVASSRLLRNYGNAFEFVIVCFREEQFQQLQGRETLSRIRDFIENGITVTRHYWFFCASASQLRDHKAYFVAASSYSEVENLRSKIVTNKHIFKSASQYLNRIGLFCTADKPATSITEYQIVRRPDIQARNGDLVTDGCGKISKAFAKEIYSALNMEGTLPSALQIRFNGIKGVALVADDEDQEMLNADLVYRDSMEKFINHDDQFCVVGVAKYNRLFLNREVITLLTSINQLASIGEERCWLVEKAIAVLHEKALCDAAKIFENALTARRALMEFLPKQLLKEVTEGGFDILSEQFWFNLLQHVYRLSVVSLRNKSRIPIDEGCLLMGAADPTEILQDNQIFLQIQEDEEEPTRIIEGDVIIYRNPCLHPGDVRRVTAVNRPELHQWKNVVLLPVYNTASSLAAACSGGDLDGDAFAVIWDRRFIPPQGKVQPPLDYRELAKDAPKDFDPQNERSLFAELYTRIIANDSLGRVAHTHLALCDILPNGACEPLAKELAKSQSQAVDFPKTGIIPLAPKCAMNMVMHKGYPDFMEKPKNSYVSEKLIGVLYRRCRSLMFDFEILTEKRRGYQLNADSDLIRIDGNEAYLNDAKEKYQMYKHCFKQIMAHFYLKREAEVVLAKPLHWNGLLRADKGAVSSAIAASYQALVNKYREDFFRDVSKDEEIRKKASAWYKTAYGKGATKQYYSFAWVVHDVLFAIKRDKKHVEIERPSAFHAQIGSSIYDELLRSQLHTETIIRTRQNVMRCVKAEVERYAGKDSFEVSTYGSVSLYLCDDESDLDVCLTARENAWIRLPSQYAASIRHSEPAVQAKHFLESTIMHAIDNIANVKTARLDAKVPLITIQVGEDDNETKVDISFNPIGLLKTKYMHQLYLEHRSAFPLLWILVRWARASGIIKSGENKAPVKENDQADQRDLRDKEGLIATAEFYALVINLVNFDIESEQRERHGQIKGTKSKKDKQVCNLSNMFHNAKYSTTLDKIQIAKMLITFFRHGSMLDKDIELLWPSNEVPNVILSAQIVKPIAIHCTNALHCILATRDISIMLSSIKDAYEQEITFTRRLPRTLLRAIGNAQSFHAARLASTSGASVNISPGGILAATGTRSTVLKLKEELHDLSTTNKAIILGRLSKKTSRYFMDGATMIVMKKNPRTDAMVSFEESKGPWNMLHHVSERHHPTLISDPITDWYEYAIDGISTRLLQQMFKLPLKNASVLDSLTISILFGCFYSINISKSLPASQQTIAISELALRIEKGRRNRKQWQRSEFSAHQGSDESGSSNQKVELHSARKSKIEKRVSKPSLKNKKKSSVTTAYCAGVLAKNTRDKHIISTSESSFKAALEECGFVKGQNGYIRDNHGWKVHCWPSSSYEVTLRLNERLAVDSVEERALKWLCVNLLDGEKQETANGLLTNSDIRINITTKDAVKETTDLYKKLVPTTEMPLLEVKKGEPVVPILCQKYSESCISTIHNVHTVHNYCKENFDAVISVGEEFCGQDLKVSRVFCDLKLRYNPNRFKDLLTAEISSENCRLIANELCKTGLELSNALKGRIKEEL